MMNRNIPFNKTESLVYYLTLNLQYIIITLASKISYIIHVIANFIPL